MMRGTHPHPAVRQASFSFPQPRRHKILKKLPLQWANTKNAGAHFRSPKSSMFPKIQTTTDKFLLFLQNRAHSTTNVLFRRHMNVSAKTPKIQTLYDLCKKTFTPSGAPPPSSQAIQKLCSILDNIDPADVGLMEEGPDDDRGHGFFGQNQFDRLARWAQPITYVNIHECDSFTICVFCFPTSAVIPLHDHPEMTVFSKVLYGSLHVKAYDWVEPPCILNKMGPVRLAKLAADKVLTAPCKTSILYPKTGGNLHCFTALTPCAVLDVLTPPYREDAGRRCSYYRDFPYFTFSNEAKTSDDERENHAWLAEIDTPEDLYMCPARYMGPVIQV